MNYIWDLVIGAENTGIHRKDLRFYLPEVFSPYMELSYTFINQTEVEPEVPINPYYRFYDIFREIFDPNYQEDEPFRNGLFDLVVHLLAEIDRMQGMNKHEYYIRFIMRDIRDGLFGERIRDSMSLFNNSEQYFIAYNLLRLYTNGEMLFLLKDTLHKVFGDAIIYANYEVKNEILFYLPVENNKVNQEKLDVIRELFLPLRFRTEVYWVDHFGIIGNSEAMKVDQIAVY
jgi:hypothetical protein